MVATKPHLSGYSLGQEIGDNVWKARHDAAKMDVVLKGPKQEDASSEVRFEYSAIHHVRDHLKRNPHPRVTLDNFVMPLSLVEAENGPFLVTKFITPQTLEDDKFYSVDSVAGTIIDLSDIVSVCHKADVLVNDLQPENWLYTPSLFKLFPNKIPFVLVDFSDAMYPRPPMKPEPTGAYIIRGTQGFMSPQQAFGESDRRADSFALGALLHYLVSGKELFENQWPKHPSTDSDNYNQEMISYALKCDKMMRRTLESPMQWKTRILHRDVPKKLYEVMRGATAYDTEKRWTLGQIRDGCMDALPKRLQKNYELNASA